MRMTGGTSKGRRLAAPRTASIRPSSDRLREALFSIIGQDLRGMNVLDLFAGTGSLGLEALSRGASMAVFVDNREEALNLIKSNVSRCSAEDRSLIIRKDLKKGILPGHFPAGMVFDLVFLDPPYGKGLSESIMLDLGEARLFSKKARIVAETSKAETPSGRVGPFIMTDSRVYGAAKLSLYSVIIADNFTPRKQKPRG